MISESQKLERAKYIGSSDIAPIMGLDSHRSAADVWLQKTGQANDFEGNANTDRGNFLEPALLNYAEHELGVLLDRNVMLVHENGLLAANLDGMNTADQFIVEAKSTVADEEWGEPGTDEAPDRVIVQVHHQLAVTGYKLAYVPVIIPEYKRFEFRMYVIQRSEPIIEAVMEAGVDFMIRHVRGNLQPSDFRPSLEVLKRIRRVPNKTILVPDELVDQVIVARAARKQAEERCEDAERKLLAVMGDAEGGEYSKGVATYLETNRKGYEVQPTKFRSLKIKSTKNLLGVSQ